MASIEKTYAIVVAIEEYHNLGQPWSLPGVVAQARKFVDWLVGERGVPAEHVQVFATGDLNFGGVPVAPANADAVNKFLAKLGEHWPQGELLLIYWVGHGFVSKDGARRLFFADATPEVKSNLDMDQFISLLRSKSRGGFETQIAVIDTCARFFETLQSTKGLPNGGLPEGLVQKEGVEQYFYFAASRGQYATDGAFGPQVLQLLRAAPAEEWPPSPRVLRSKIEELFDQLLANRAAGQEPAWLEYRDGKDNRLMRGLLPTRDGIQEVAERADVPLSYLRTLTQIAASCPKLATKEGRDEIARALHLPEALFRLAETQEDPGLDLLSIIAGAIEQDVGQQLAKEIVRVERNSNPAHLFEKTMSKVATLRDFWPLLAETKLPIGRAQVLFRASHRLWMEPREPESVEEVVEILHGLVAADMLVEFLLRSSKERPGDANCRRLGQWLKDRKGWEIEWQRANERLDNESRLPRYLLVRVEEREGVGRVTRSWLWMSNNGDPLELDTLPEVGTLAGDIATLLNYASQKGGRVYLEIMLPESLMHLAAKQLAWKNRGKERDLESLHPVALRWRERMDTPGDPAFETGRWRQAAERIEARRKEQAARVGWVDRTCDSDAFSRGFEQGHYGELVGLEVESEGEGRSAVVTLICNGGLPYACWPRRQGVDLTAAKAEVGRMIGRGSFEEVPLIKNEYSLADLLLLWDDPRRNPYDRRMKDVK